MNKAKRILSLILAIIMIASSLSVFSFADTGKKITDIKVEKISLIYNYDGYDDEGFFRYVYSPNFTVCFDDGSEQKSSFGNFYYNGEWHQPEITDNQSYENQWGMGKYSATFKLFGITKNFDVNIISSPVKSITVKDDIILYKTDGDYDYDYNEETGEFDLKYFRYEYNTDATINFNDGTSLTTDGIFEYNGNAYLCEFEDNQSYENQWDVGTHNVNIHCMGISTQIKVTVIEKPQISISYKNNVIKDLEGHIDYDYNEETGKYDLEYFKYDYDLKITANFSDGTVATGTDYIIYKNKKFEFVYIDGQQSYDNPWDIGEHTISMSIFGDSRDITIDVCENTVESIKAKDITVYKGLNLKNGYVTYYPETTIKFKDGTTKTSFEDYFYYNDTHYRFMTFSDNQTGDNKWDVGVYDATVNCIDKSDDFKVTVKENPYSSLQISGYNELKVNLINPNGEDLALNATNFYTRDKSESHAIGTLYTDKGAFDATFNLSDEKVSLQIGDLISNEIDKGTWIDTKINHKILGKYGKDKYSHYEICEHCHAIINYQYHIYDNNEDLICDICGYEREPIPTSGTIGECTWSLNGTVLTISGNGSMGPIYDGAPWGSSITEVIIEEGVTDICNSAFFGCGNLTKVTIANTVTNIRDHAFYACTSLEEISIPDSVTNISYFAFSKCTFLEKVKLSNNLTTISDSLFRNCDFLKDITIPQSVTSIGNYAFMGCSWLKNIIIPENVTKIGTNAFKDCIRLESITFTKSSVTIKDYAFNGCKKLSDVYSLEVQKQWNVSVGSNNDEFVNAKKHYSDVDKHGSCGEQVNWVLDGDIGVLTISGSGAMTNYSSISIAPWMTYDYLIKKVVIEDGVTSIGDQAFNNCSELISVSIGKDVKSIGKSAFNSCILLDNIKLPENVTTININAFSGCKKLADITLPSNITTIMAGTFSNCISLKKITLSNNIKRIVVGAFNNCTSLETVKYAGTSDDWSKITIAAKNDPILNCHNIIYNYSAQPQILYGDANGDGNIDDLDVVMLITYLANYDWDTGLSSVKVGMGADANGDDNTDDLDVVMLITYLANYDWDTGLSSVILGPQK